MTIGGGGMTEQVQWADDVEPDILASGTPSRFDETVGDYAADQINIPKIRHPVFVRSEYDALSDVVMYWFSKYCDVLETSSATMEGVKIDALNLAFDDPEDVFGSLDSQGDRHQRIKKIVQHIRKALALKDRDRIANRIEVLEEARLEELDYGDRPLSPKSLEAFESFLKREPCLKYPILTLSPDGFVFAEWEAAPNQYFAVKFLGTNDDVRYVIFAPKPGYPDKRLRTSGDATVDTLMSYAESHGVRNWVGMEDE